MGHIALYPTRVECQCWFEKEQNIHGLKTTKWWVGVKFSKKRGLYQG